MGFTPAYWKVSAGEAQVFSQCQALGVHGCVSFPFCCKPDLIKHRIDLDRGEGWVHSSFRDTWHIKPGEIVFPPERRTVTILSTQSFGLPSVSPFLIKSSYKNISLFPHQCMSVITAGTWPLPGDWGSLPPAGQSGRVCSAQLQHRFWAGSIGPGSLQEARSPKLFVWRIPTLKYWALIQKCFQH